MSTVVYKDGVMACDTRAFAGFNSPLGQKSKIRQQPNGGLVGVTTNIPGLGEAFMEWICDETGEVDEPVGEVRLTALCVEPNGEVFYYNDGLLPSGPIDAPFFAIGSGGDPAMGALHMGATIEQAIEIAAKCDVWTDLPVKTLTLQREKVKS